jgi:hypothetical protein
MRPRNQTFKRLKYFEGAIISCAMLRSAQDNTLVHTTDFIGAGPAGFRAYA